MVGRRDDDHDGAGHVDHAGRASPDVAGAQEHDPGAPQGPPDVQRRHRGELVGQAPEPARRAGVGAPPALVRRRGQRVDVPREESGRRHGHERETHQPGGGAQHQGVADVPVPAGVGAIGPDQHRRGDHVVQQGVPEAAEEGEVRQPGKRGVGPALDVEVQGRLRVEQGAGVGRRRAQVRVGDQAGGAVRHVQRGEQRQLPHWLRAGRCRPDGRRGHDRQARGKAAAAASGDLPSRTLAGPLATSGCGACHRAAAATSTLAAAGANRPVATSAPSSVSAR